MRSEAPRWSSKPGTLPSMERNQYELQIEDRFPDDVVLELAKKGHVVKRVESGRSEARN